VTLTLLIHSQLVTMWVLRTPTLPITSARAETSFYPTIVYPPNFIM
jgi:hypothetical protein